MTEEHARRASRPSQDETAPAPDRAQPNTPPTNRSSHDALPAAQTADEWAIIGEVSGTFGVRGDLKVRPQTDFPDHFLRAKTLYLGAEHRPYPVASASLHMQQIILHLAGIDTMTEAERLRNQPLSIPTAELTPLAPDQFYQHDIVGLRVRHVNGQLLGVITDIIVTGANDIYLVRNEHTGVEAMLPAVKEFITSVDMASGEITVNPIPGLFDDNYEEAQ